MNDNSADALTRPMEWNPELLDAHYRELGWTPPAEGDGADSEPPNLEQLGAMEYDFGARPWDAVWDDARFRRVSWLLDGWLPARSVTAVAGQGGVGKTRIAMQLAAAVAMGDARAWATDDDGADGQLSPELSADECGPVIWATWETAPGAFAQRLEAIAPEFPPHMRYLNMRRAGALWGPEHGRHTDTRGGPLPAWYALLDAADRYGARLVVLDPLAAAYAASENNRALVRPFLSALADWADNESVAVLLISHPPKSTGAAYSGSTDWLAGVQAQWTCELCACKVCLPKAEQGEEPTAPLPDEERYRKLSVAKLNEGAPPPPLYFHWSSAFGSYALASHGEERFAGLPAPRRRRKGKAYGNGKASVWD